MPVRLPAYTYMSVSPFFSFASVKANLQHTALCVCVCVYLCVYDVAFLEKLPDKPILVSLCNINKIKLKLLKAAIIVKIVKL